MADKQIKIGIGDMKLARQEGTLITYALGSCIGITLYDPNIKLGALIHIMLPNATGANAGNVFKFADTGIRETLRKLAAFGGVKSRYVCKIAGGAQMFAFSSGNDMMRVGDRNVEAVKAKLMQMRIRILAEDTGKNYGRTIEFYSETGKLLIKSVGKEKKYI